MFNYTITPKAQMKIAIMQPYFFPYLGYFALIKHTEQFILFDTPQFIRHGWIERNQILKQDGNKLYIKVPLIKHSRESRIMEVLINNNEDWQNKILAQLAPYKKKAPYYYNVTKLIKEIFNYKTDSIVDFNFHSLRLVCNYLNIDTPIKIWSKMDVKIEDANAPDEWALNICKALKAETYYNPIGGTSFFDTEKYINSGIEIKFMEIIPTKYNQISNEFVPYLSVIDVMMFNSKEDIQEMLNQYTLV